VDVALGEGDGDVVFPEEGIDAVAQVGLDAAAVHGAGDIGPEEEGEMEGIITELIKEHEDFFILQDALVFARGLFDEVANFAGVAPVGDADIDLAAHVAVEERPIDDGLFEEVAVGGKDVDAIGAAHADAAVADIGNFALGVLQFNDIADADGLFEHDDNARDEVVEEVLGAEADTDGDGPAEDGEDGDGDAGDGQGDEDDNDYQQVVKDFLQEIGGIVLEIADFPNAAAE